MMDVIAFTVPGEPVGKGRPRFVRATGRTYTPEKTANYETLVKWEYDRTAHGRSFEGDSQLCMRIIAYFQPPKSAGKKRLAAMLDGAERPTKKPDADNILKAVADALNGLAYRDDSQIVYAEVYKRYAELPRVEVTLWRLWRQEGGQA